MVWAIVVVAIGVLGVGAWAGTGRLGEMPDAVTDRPKAHVPDGPVDEVFLEHLSLPGAGTGYRRSQVDALLAAHVSGEDIKPGTRFDVVRKGYDMQAVDAVIDRIDVHEYPDTAGDSDDDHEFVTAPDESSVVEEHVASAARIGRIPPPDDVLEGEDADENSVTKGISEPPEESERAARGDSPSV